MRHTRTFTACDRLTARIFTSLLVAALAIALDAGVNYAEAQTYTGDPNYTITDVQTNYDGIGTVTPMTVSILERVLSTVDQLETSSPGSVAPINGIYANIAESISQTEWYSTNRTEVSYQDQVTLNEGTLTATWENISAPPGNTGFTVGSVLSGPNGETSVVGDAQYITIHYFYRNWLVSGNFELFYAGSRSFTLTEYEAIVGTDIFDESNLTGISLDTGGSSFVFQTNGDLVVKSADPRFIPVIEFDGNPYLMSPILHQDIVDDMSLMPIQYASSAYPGTTFLNLTNIPLVRADSTIDYTQTEFTGVLSGTFPFSNYVNGSSLIWLNGQLELASASRIADLTSNSIDFYVATYDYSVQTAASTTQFNAYYDDWWQRELSTTIDGSVTNIISGVGAGTEDTTAAAATARSITLPTIDIGDIATTALGAVNTGDITVGVNSAVDEAASSTTRAIQASLTVVGGSADTGTMILNIAHNTSIIRGNVDNTLIAMNGSVGNISTTALGAVNTGTITSGVNAAVQGIVGLSGVN